MNCMAMTLQKWKGGWSDGLDSNNWMVFLRIENADMNSFIAGSLSAGRHWDKVSLKKLDSTSPRTLLEQRPHFQMVTK